jgi:uncharacterized membrane protein
MAEMADYPPPGLPPVSHHAATVRVLVALSVGVVAGAIAAGFVAWEAAPLVGWDAATLTWVVWMWFTILHFDAVTTSLHATREDPGRAVVDALLLGASVASLVAVGLVVAKAAGSHGDQKAMLLVISMLSVIGSWAVVHTLFTLRYAAIYYRGPDGGIDFNETEGSKPSYADFAYLAFTIGMTYQVSDTNLTDGLVRRTALRHALLSYVFGTVIIAAAINLAAGLAR